MGDQIVFMDENVYPLRIALVDDYLYCRYLPYCVASEELRSQSNRALVVNDRYDEEFVKDVLSVIVEERTATEKQKAAELEEKQKATILAQQRER
ncbi:hypothetical protein TNCV_3650571 [Trichonephila clavipes]|uniref:Uncharacterized protein n=1 Tax=Trichonephila clavipes TaxID=2585209 RepID=A0A8X6VIT2_TRICX|nr:hypothetical protein TNCV_3650571 [Trichonephila clavipes]